MSELSREEAIKCIEAIHVQMFNDGNSKWTKACDMAIEALETHDELCENLAWYINERQRLLKVIEYSKPNEGLQRTIKKALERPHGDCRDRLKEVFREYSEIGGDLFHLSQIENIIDGEVWL